MPAFSATFNSTKKKTQTPFIVETRRYSHRDSDRVTYVRIEQTFPASGGVDSNAALVGSPSEAFPLSELRDGVTFGLILCIAPLLIPGSPVVLPVVGASFVVIAALFAAVCFAKALSCGSSFSGWMTPFIEGGSPRSLFNGRQAPKTVQPQTQRPRVQSHFNPTFPDTRPPRQL